MNRVAVVGKSMHMAGLAASLKANPALQIVRVNPDSISARQDIDALAPDVVIFDLVEPCPDLTISLLRERPGLLLLGMDPSRDEMLVLSGYPERVLSIQDLLQVVNRKAVAQPERSKEELPTHGTSSVVHNRFQSKQIQFIQKEIKMKNLTKRNQIVLAIAAVLVIVVVAVVAFSQLGGAQLFGTVTYPYFNPASASINAGKTVTLKVVGNPAMQAPKCTFTTPSTAVTLSGATSTTVVVTGVWGGSATITARCNIGTLLTSLTAQVTVSGPTPTPTPTVTPTPMPPLTITVGPDTGKSVAVIGYGEYLTLCASDPTIRPENWTVVSPYPTADAISMVGSSTPGCIVALGNYHGTATAHATFRATNATGSQGSVVVYEYDALSITPAYPVMNVGQSITMSMTGAEGSSPWSIYKGCENSAPADCPVRLSATSGHSVTITAQKAGTVLITCKRVSGGGWSDTGLTQVIVR